MVIGALPVPGSLKRPRWRRRFSKGHDFVHIKPASPP
jgi:hypothetical protein